MFLISSDIMDENTLGQWSDNDDDWIWDVNENTLGDWSDGDDDWICEIDDLREQSNDESAELNTLGEWSDGNDDWIWDVNENTLGEWTNGNDDWDADESDLRSDPETDDSVQSDPQTDDTIQAGRGEKRKSDEPLLPEKDFYEMESVTKHKSKKFQMTATDHTIRFNNVLNELDLIESYERT